MQKLFHITLNDLRVTFKEREIFINLFIIPIVLIVAVGAAQGGLGSSGSVPTLRLDILATAQSPSTTALLDAIRAANPRLVLCPYDGAQACALEDATTLDEALALTRIEDGTSRGVVIIPADFDDAVRNGTPTALVYRSDDDPLQPSFLLQSIQAGVTRIAGVSVATQVGEQVFTDVGFTFEDTADANAFRAALFRNASTLWSDSPVSVEFIQSNVTNTDDDTQNEGFQQSVPGMGSMYVMFNVLAGASVLLLERKNWTLQRLVMMPITRAQLLGGKILSRFIMGMLQYSVAFATGLVLGVSFGNSPLALLLLMMAFVGCIAALAFLLATLVESDQQASTLITFLALTLAPLGGAWWPLEIVPRFMQTIAYFTPVGWVMDGFTQVIVYGAGVGGILTHVGVLLSMALVMFGLAVWRFRYD